MTRTSARKSALKARASLREEDTEGEEDAVQTEEEEQESEHEAPPPKKRRTSTAAKPAPRPKVKGALKDFLNLPLELVLRIVNELDLPTIFHLSRLSKRFWQLLRGDKSMRDVWRDARKRSGISKMTAPGLTVFQHANLMFGCCQGCGKATTKVDWVLRIRACPSCSKNLICDKRDALTAHKPALEIAPFSQMDSNGGERKTKHFSKADLRSVTQMLNGVIKAQRLALNNAREPGPQDDTLDWVARAIASPNFKLRGFSSLGNPRTKAKFVAGLDSIAKKRVERILKWFDTQEILKRNARDALLKKRRHDIEERFKAEGYLPHHFDFADWRNHPTMSVAKDLTDNAFDSLKFELDALLSTHRNLQDQHALKMERLRLRNIVSDEYTRLTRNVDIVKTTLFDPVPPLIEFLDLPPVQALVQVDLIEQVGKVVPPSIADCAEEIAKSIEETCAATEEALLGSLIETLAEVQKARNDGIKASSTASTGTPAASTATPASFGPQIQLLPDNDMQKVLDHPELFKDDLLPRAISLVTCRQCDRRDPVNEILHHKCYGHHLTSLRPENYYIHAATVKATVEVILSADKDMSVTPKEMDDLGYVFSCECSWRPVIAQDWSRMVSHIARNHAAQGLPLHRLVCESEEDAKQRVYKKHIETLDRQYSRAGWGGLA